MDEKPPIPPPASPSTALSQIPATDPAILKRMEESRIETLHYAAIGRVAAAWSYLEASIDTSAISLAKVDWSPGACFTAQIAGSGRKLDAYIAIARLRELPQKLVKDLNDYAKEVQNLSERRNRTVHDVWYFNHPDSPQRLEVSARKLLRLERIPTTTQTLLNLATEINEEIAPVDVEIGRQALPTLSR